MDFLLAGHRPPTSRTVILTGMNWAYRGPFRGLAATASVGSEEFAIPPTGGSAHRRGSRRKAGASNQRVENSHRKWSLRVLCRKRHAKTLIVYLTKVIAMAEALAVKEIAWILSSNALYHKLTGISWRWQCQDVDLSLYFSLAPALCTHSIWATIYGWYVWTHGLSDLFRNFQYHCLTKLVYPNWVAGPQGRWIYRHSKNDAFYGHGKCRPHTRHPRKLPSTGKGFSFENLPENQQGSWTAHR